MDQIRSSKVNWWHQAMKNAWSLVMQLHLWSRAENCSVNNFLHSPFQHSISAPETFPTVATSSTFQLWPNLQPLLKWNPFSSVTFEIKPHPKCPQSVCPWQFHCCWLTVICFLIESANSPASVFDKNKPPHGSSFSWAQKISLGKEAIIFICSSIKENRLEIVSCFWSQGISENIYRFSSSAFSLFAVLYGWFGITAFNQTIKALRWAKCCCTVLGSQV